MGTTSSGESNKTPPSLERWRSLGRAHRACAQPNRNVHPPGRHAVPIQLARAFAGLGLVMEFLAHRVKQIAAPLTKIPVELTAVEVGPSDHGREMISIDISEYGDPLYSRMLRVPFSVYLKPWQQPWGFDVDVLARLKPLFVIPLQGIDWREGIFAMRDPGWPQNWRRRSQQRFQTPPTALESY